MKRTAKVHEDEEEEEGGRGIWDCGSPLYDSYELVSLSSIIDRNLMKLPSFRKSRRVTAAAASQTWQSEISASSRSGSSGRNSNTLSPSSSMAPGKKKKKKEKRKKGCKNMLLGFCRRILLLRKDASGND